MNSVDKLLHASAPKNLPGDFSLQELALHLQETALMLTDRIIADFGSFDSLPVIAFLREIGALRPDKTVISFAVVVLMAIGREAYLVIEAFGTRLASSPSQPSRSPPDL